MTAEMRSAVEAKQLVPFYTRRGRVEDIFRMLKSGGKVETLRRPQADRWPHAITLHLVTAWRIMLMTRLGGDRLASRGSLPHHGAGGASGLGAPLPPAGPYGLGVGDVPSRNTCPSLTRGP